MDDSRIRILVVDDHPNTANMLARAISRLGSNVDVVSAASGHEALKHAGNEPVDILITDLMMPEMTGMELIETLKDQPSISPAVSYLLTAYDSPEVRETASRLHVKQVISKPVHTERICQIVTQSMDDIQADRKNVNLQKRNPLKLNNERKLQ